MNIWASVVLVAGAVAASGCLPADARPTPGSVILNMETPAELRSGVDAGPLAFQTDDGWQVTIDQLWVSVGRVALSGDDCNPYSELPYLRIVDLTQGSPQRVGQVWGLSDCQLDYQAHVPDAMAVLGEGVTAAERDEMQNHRGFVSSEGGVDTAPGTAVRLLGSASKDQQRVGFDWGFADPHTFTKCRRSIDAAIEAHLPLAGGQTLPVALSVDPRRLFVAPEASPPAPAAALAQQIFAADRLHGDADGQIDLSELAQVSLTDESQSIAQTLLRTNYPAMFEYAGGTHCDLDAPPDEITVSY